MKPKLVLPGLIFWIVATLALRLAGQRILAHCTVAVVLLLFIGGFVGVALLVRRVCKGFGLALDQWPVGAISLLLLPNMPPESAGVFGGWMLICCAGGLIGASVRQSR